MHVNCVLYCFEKATQRNNKKSLWSKNVNFIFLERIKAEEELEEYVVANIFYFTKYISVSNTIQTCYILQ